MAATLHCIFEVQQLGPSTATETFHSGALADSPDEARQIVRGRYPRATSITLLSVKDALQARADEIAKADREGRS